MMECSLSCLVTHEVSTLSSIRIRQLEPRQIRIVSILLLYKLPFLTVHALVYLLFDSDTKSLSAQMSKRSLHAMTVTAKMPNSELTNDLQFCSRMDLFEGERAVAVVPEDILCDGGQCPDQ